MGMSYKVYSPG